MKRSIRNLIRELRLFQKRILFEMEPENQMTPRDQICDPVYIQQKLNIIGNECGFADPWLQKWKYKHVWSFQYKNICVDFVLWKKDGIWVCCEIWRRIA